MDFESGDGKKKRSSRKYARINEVLNAATHRMYGRLTYQRVRRVSRARENALAPTSRRETPATLARNELSPRNVHQSIAYAASSVAVLSSSRCGLVLDATVDLALLSLRDRAFSLSSCCLRKYEGEGGSIIVPVDRPKR